jgi:folate-dependent phosphoribosylglycinamide formyltransferase PurN
VFEINYKLNQPIRVVLFGGGPGLNHDVREFLCRLEAHPEIELLAAFCQAESQSWKAIYLDLWHRRGLLAFPLLIARIFSILIRFVKNPKKELDIKNTLARISDHIHSVKDIHAETVIARVRSLEPDLGLIYGSPILKPDLFEIPRLGTLGIHHGKVPAYRGNKTTFWAMYNGETVAGVTIQKINAGLDTGGIAKEGEVPIGLRSYRAVWRDLETLGLELYLQAILEVKNGTAIYRPQIGKKEKLYRNPKLKDFLMFWIRHARRQLGKKTV